MNFIVGLPLMTHKFHLIWVIVDTCIAYADCRGLSIVCRLVCGNSFAYMHCWSMKDHPKWTELRPMCTTGDSLDEVLGDEVPQDSNTIDLSAEPSPPAGSRGK
jgi:hypothetical protein